MLHMFGLGKVPTRLRILMKKDCRGHHPGLKQLVLEGRGHQLLWTSVAGRPTSVLHTMWGLLHHALG